MENDVIVLAERCAKCEKEPEPGSFYCMAHGGAIQKTKEKKARLYDLNKTEYLRKLSDRAIEMEASPEFVSVKSELGILRVVLERVLEQCDSHEKLVLRQGEITNLIDKIARLALQLKDTEKELGLLLSREQTKEIAGELLKVLLVATEQLKQKIESTKLTLRADMSDDLFAKLDSMLSPDLFFNFMEKVADDFGRILHSQDRN